MPEEMYLILEEIVQMLTYAFANSILNPDLEVASPACTHRLAIHYSSNILSLPLQFLLKRTQ